jgi:hypothetical protein
LEPKDEIVSGDLYLKDEKVFVSQKPIEKPVAFYDYKPK